MLLTELAATPASELKVASLFDSAVTLDESLRSLPSYKDEEAKFRLAFNLAGNGEGARKLTQAINIFCDMQIKLEGMMV